MLVVTRSKGEAVRIGHEISVTVLEVRGGQVHLRIRSPSLPVDREEVYLRKYGGGAGVPLGSTPPPNKER